MFSKTCVLKTFCNIRRKTPVFESVFNKVIGLQRSRTHFLELPTTFNPTPPQVSANGHPLLKMYFTLELPSTDFKQPMHEWWCVKENCILTNKSKEK